MEQYVNRFKITMEAVSYIKNIKISPKKLRFLLTDIKKRKPQEALDALLYSPKKGARFFYQAIKSALSNAKIKFQTDQEDIFFKTIAVEEGRKLKRFKAGGRGVVKPIVRRYSHIKVVLTMKDKLKQENSNLKNQNVKVEVKKKK